MEYKNTFNNLMSDISNPNITENTLGDASLTTVYEDFRITISNELFTNANLNNTERIFVYVSNTQNVIYLSNKNSLGDDFGIFKILKHTPNKGIRLNIGKILNIGTVPCEVKVQVENGMIKIYPKDGLEKLPATKAFEKVSETIKEVYGFTVYQFIDRFGKGVI